MDASERLCKRKLTDDFANAGLEHVGEVDVYPVQVLVHLQHLYELVHELLIVFAPRSELETFLDFPFTQLVILVFKQPVMGQIKRAQTIVLLHHLDQFWPADVARAQNRAAKVDLSDVLRVSEPEEELGEGPVGLCRIHQSQHPQSRVSVHERLAKQLYLAASHATVDKSQFHQVVRRPPSQQRVQVLDCTLTQPVLPVHNRLEKLLMLQIPNHFCKVLAGDSTGVKEELLESGVVEEFDGFCETVLAAVAEGILLQAKRLELDLVKDRHQDVTILQAFGIESDNWIVGVQDALPDMLWLLLLEHVVKLDLIDKVVAHFLNQLALCGDLVIEYAQFWRLPLVIRILWLSILLTVPSPNRVHFLLNTFSDETLDQIR